MFKCGEKCPLSLGQAPESCEELSVVAQASSILRVSLNCSLVEGFGGTQVAAPVLQEHRVVTEGGGVLGVSLNRPRVEHLGGVHVPTPVLQEQRVVTEVGGVLGIRSEEHTS